MRGELGGMSERRGGVKDSRMRWRQGRGTVVGIGRRGQIAGQSQLGHKGYARAEGGPAERVVWGNCG